MAVTRVSRTKDGRAAIRYALEEKSHKQGMERVLASSGSNLDPKFAMLQMKAVWDSSGKNDGKSVQVYRLIQSFGLDELDPENPEDIEKANLLGLELAKELYPDRQALIATQADGEGGKLHNHILINSVSAIDGKSLGGGKRNKTTHWKTVSDASDRVLERHGMKPLVPDEKRPKLSIAETKIREAGEYSWKEDLAGRIGDALYAPGVTDKDTFEKYMFDEHDVTVKFGKSNRVKYAFEDADGNGQNAGIKALGAPCGMENIQRAFERNERVAQEKLAQQRLEDAEKERLAMAAQPEVLEVSGVDAFNLDAELAKITKRSKSDNSRSKVSKFVEPDMAREVREEREARQAAEKAAAKMDGLHGEALVMNDEVDSLRAKEAAAAAREEAERKSEQEKQKKAEEDARKAIEALEEAKRQEEIEKAEKLREDALKRLQDSRSVIQGEVIPRDVLTRFMSNEKKLTGTMRNTPAGKELHTTNSIYFRTKSDMADEKRAERQSVQQSVEQAQPDGPEL